MSCKPPGPKSRGCSRRLQFGLLLRLVIFVWLVQQIMIKIVRAAVDARVGLYEHRESPGAAIYCMQNNSWAKHGASRNTAHASSQGEI